ncbi:MAG: Eco57I restriction-modification methylase domain-containing protein [Oscillospiraceae bacterium]
MSALHLSDTEKLGLSKKALSAKEYANFRANFQSYLEKIKKASLANENEEHIKNIINDFLRMNFFSESKYTINTDGNIDSAIKENDDLLVIIETKAPSNKAEMITESNINRKAFHEAVYYYLERAVDTTKSKAMIFTKCQLRRLTVTDGINWFLFDINKIHSITDGKIEHAFYQYKNGQRPYKDDTATFYEELRQYFDEMNVNEKLEYLYFNVEEAGRSKSQLSTIFKILSPDYLTKTRIKFNYEPHKLNEKFYHELLYIMGLKEVEKDNRVLVEIDTSITNSLSFQINRLLNKKDTPESEIDQRIFELVIIWINRLLFIKLFEGQLISFNSDESAYHILDNEKIQSFEDLECLFFEVLGKKKREENIFFNQFSEIPYLNSSLFEKQDIETGQGVYHNGIMISELKNEPIRLYSSSVLGKKIKKDPDILTYIIDFLNSYNFASDEANVDENSSREILDAAVLGLIFEKLNGYRDGSTYTPSVITEYLAKETVEKTVLQKVNTEMGWKCGSLVDIRNKLDTLEQRKRVDEIINSITICDPSVGSGHFLVSALNYLIAAKKECEVLFIYGTDKLLKDCQIFVEKDVLCIKYGDGSPFVYKRKSNESREIQGTLFNEKRTIIENCLFGSDINVTAVSICQLRLWIELLKNAYYDNGVMETLPNIDINIKTGNSLTYYAKFEVGESIIKSNKNSSEVDSSDLASLREYRNSVKEYKSCSDKFKKKQIIAKIKQIKDNLFYNDAQQHLEDKKDSANKFDNAIEWAIEFPEVIDENGKFTGFDIVIGNPPYIQLQKMNNGADTLAKMNYATYVRSGDIYCLFYELAYKLLKKNGMLAYISSNKWMRAGYGEALRNFLVTKTDPVQLIDFSGEKVFQKVTVDVNILIYRKAENQFNTLSCIIKGSDWRNNLSDYVRQYAVSNRFDSSGSWVILSPVEQSIKRKIESIGTPLKDWNIKIYRGILTGYNEAFIIDGKKKDELISADSKSAEIIRPILRGRDIKRYGFDFADCWVILAKYGSYKYLESTYPAVYEHLCKYKEKLKNRGQCRYTSSGKVNSGKDFPGQHHWLELDNNPCQEYLDDFSKQKIVWKRIGSILRFCYDESGMFCLDSTCFATGDKLKFLTLLLNSPLGRYLLKDSPKTGTGDLLISVQALEPMLTPPISNNENYYFEELFDNYIQTSGTDKEKLNIEINTRLLDLFGFTDEERRFILLF